MSENFQRIFEKEKARLENKLKRLKENIRDCEKDLVSVKELLQSNPNVR